MRDVARVLPPGLSAGAFDKAIAAFKAVVGGEWTRVADDALEPYRDPYSFRWDSGDEYRASAVVLPETAEQVQAVILAANKHRIPLYPISRGKNLTYGGAAPTLSGSVIVDLRRMNRIIAIDDKRNFALVEPGVSYFDLYRHIQERGLKVWLDVPDTGWGSLIGNALEYGVGYTASQFRDHFAAHCGMEVVLPTGELMRTGMGALPGADSWQDYRYGVGPYVDGLFAQSNFGIVTKMGFWLMPQPEAWLTGIVDVQQYSDLAALIEQVNYLEDSQVMNGKPLYNCPPFHPFEGNFPSAVPPATLEDLMANGWPSAEQIMIHSRRHGGPAWWVKLQFYGPEKTIRASWDYVQKRMTKAIPGATCRGMSVVNFPLTDAQRATANLVDFGIPSLSVFAKSAAELDADEMHGPLQGHGDFLAILPRTAAAVMKAQRVLYDTQKAIGAPLTATPFHAPIAWRHRSFLMGSPTTALYQSSPERNVKAGLLYEAYLKNMAAAGFPPYRTSPAMQDLLAAQFSYNDHALLRFKQKLKDAADPNGVIAPGRYGLWPKSMRKTNT